ncbi:MAG: VF530 family protein [Chloroflexota bacterium]
MSGQQVNNPLHGITLKQIVTSLVAHYGWERLGQQINIRCFTHNPSVKSSLKFLRRTPWARKKVEELYLDSEIDSDL